MHVWPELRNLVAMHPATARSMLALGKTISGALPPSSRDIRLSVDADCCMTILPVLVDPVTDTAPTASCVHRTDPTSAALAREHGTTLNTPAGESGIIDQSSAKAIADSGVSSLGFKTVVHPTARADAAFLVIIAIGKFQLIAARVGYDLTVKPLHLLGIVLDERSAVVNLPQRLGKRFAHFQHDQRRKLLPTLHDVLVPLHENIRSLSHGKKCPAPLGNCSTFYSSSGIIGCKVSNMCNLLTTGWISDRKAAAWPTCATVVQKAFSICIALSGYPTRNSWPGAHGPCFVIVPLPKGANQAASQ
eukprot:scpid56476/ scgid12508/ 